MNRYFSKLYAGLSEEQLEDYHRAVFMNMEGDCAAARRVEYYQGKLRLMGKNVKIGCGVKMLNPQYISLGDGAVINDHCVLMALGEKGITLELAPARWWSSPSRPIPSRSACRRRSSENAAVRQIWTGNDKLKGAPDSNRTKSSTRMLG